MKRKLGQHFLIDESLLDRLVEYGEVSRRDVVLEVGAGRGELTRRLAERAGKVLAVELDEGLAAEARERLRKHGNVELMIGDVLKLKPTGFNKVVSNPPYQISTPLLRWLILSLPERIVMTLQREFASKLMALPGSRKYVYTSFLARLLYRLSVAEYVPRTLFRPVPRVDSAVVVMERKEERAPGKEVLRFVKLFFTRRRQTLRRVLAGISENLGVELERVEAALPPNLSSKRILAMTPQELLLCSNTLIKLLRNGEKP